MKHHLPPILETKIRENDNEFPYFVKYSPLTITSASATSLHFIELSDPDGDSQAWYKNLKYTLNVLNSDIFLNEGDQQPMLDTEEFQVKDYTSRSLISIKF